MRIIAGKFRGRALASVGKGDPSAHLRPTTDRVRESLFNILAGGKFGDPVTGARVLDLCAGTGALGLEALSRGAVHTTFVDSGKKAISLIKQNAEICGASEHATILKRDVIHLGPAVQPSDLVFIDPPYGKNIAARALPVAAEKGWISDGALVVSEDNAPMPQIENFTLLDSRRIAGSTISFLRHDGALRSDETAPPATM